MKSSIRKFLLVNLLLAITITTTLTAIGNYYLDQKDIQEHLDTLMSVAALSYQALLGDDLHQRHLDQIQQVLNQIPANVDRYYTGPLVEGEIPEHYMNKFTFQIWAKNGRLLLHSVNAPKESLATKGDGFHDTVVDGQKWRVFSTINSTIGTRTVLAESYAARNELGRRITQDDLYIMLLTFPLSGLLIWIIIGRGLDSLDRVAREVSHREPSRLDPVNLEAVPEEIKPVIDELNQLFHRLKAGFDREKRFAADAAHELRTPLAALKTQAQVALNTNTVEEKNQALQKLIISVNRSTHIVQQLLTMSKLQPEAVNALCFSPINIQQVCQEILAMIVPAALEKQIELEFEAAGNLPKIPGDATAVGILVRNLVDNAVRYTQEQGQVIVRLYIEKKKLVLEVQDTGPGIPEKLRKRVFERFYRVLGNKSTGSGLGLGIVQQIASMHKADLHLDSGPGGQGLVVQVRFPLSLSRGKQLQRPAN